MSWCVYYYKFTLFRREVAIGNIDRDTLLAFGAQTVSEVCKIHLTATSDIRRPLQCLAKLKGMHAQRC